METEIDTNENIEIQSLIKESIKEEEIKEDINIKNGRQSSLLARIFDYLVDKRF